MTTRWSKPSGGKRKVPRKQDLSRVKPAALSKTAARILQPETDKRGKERKLRKEKKLAYNMLIYIQYIKYWAGQKSHTFNMSDHSEVGENFGKWPQAWSEGQSPFIRKQRHHRFRPERQRQRHRETRDRHTEGDEREIKRDRKKNKHPGLTEAPSWSTTWDSQFILVT